MPQTKRVQILDTDFVNLDFSDCEAFDAICKAMLSPGERIYVNYELAALEELHFAAAASCLILMGHKTLFWTDLNWNSETVRWLHVHSGCTLISEPCMATCALITKPAQMPPLKYFRMGDDQSPSNATLLIIQTDDIQINQGRKLAGPGVKKLARLTPKGMSNDFWEQCQAQSRDYALGVDIIFTCEDALVALPRSTQICH